MLEVANVNVHMWVAVQVAMQQSATDPDTGAIDMDIIQTGVSASRRRDREALANELAQLLLGKPPAPAPMTVLHLASLWKHGSMMKGQREEG